MGIRYNKGVHWFEIVLTRYNIYTSSRGRFFLRVGISGQWVRILFTRYNIPA
jgi:hypothetical protein